MWMDIFSPVEFGRMMVTGVSIDPRAPNARARGPVVEGFSAEPEAPVSDVIFRES